MSTQKRGQLKLAEDISFDPWWWQARNRTTLPEPDLPSSIDYAIVGGGYTGLSAALTLAEAGAKVAVFDAADPGDGASTRNGGMVGNRIKPGFEYLLRKYGEKPAVAMLDEGRKAVDYLETLVTDHGIDCSFGRMGRYSPAVNRAHWKAMKAGIEIERDHRDVNMEMVAPEEQSQFLKSPLYHGGKLQHDTGGLHPARYHDGLLAAARRAGVIIMARTEVVGLEETDTGMALETSVGFIEAGKVLICTNGYTGPQLPELQKRVVPVTSAIIATEELDPDLVARLIPGGRMVVDSYHLLNYFRPSPDGKRILLGSRPGWGGGTEARLASYLGKRLGGIFPDLDGTAITHCWWGKVAFSFDTFPKIGMTDKVGYAMGYAGSGVAMSTWLGHKLGQKAMDDLSGRTAFDDLGFPAPFYYNGWPWFLGPLVGWYGFSDWLARRT